jgi:hypothetical protein
MNNPNQKQEIPVRLIRLHRTFKHALAVQLRHLIVAIEACELEYGSAESKQSKSSNRKVA